MKHKYIAKKHWGLGHSAMSGSDALKGGCNDLIDFSIGNPDLVTPIPIIDAAIEDAKNGYTGYGSFRGDPELVSEIVKQYKKDYGMDISSKEIYITPSATAAMYICLKSILDEGDEVIVQAPYYTKYIEQVELTGGKFVTVDTYEEEDFQIDPTRLEAAITDKTKAIILNTPSNPTGNCLSIECMKEIAKIVEKHDILVIADDIYTAYSYQEEFVPFASLPGMFERTITINTVSKNFLMTGWRLAWIVAPDYLTDVFQIINDGIAFTACSVSQRAAIYALKHRKEIQPAITKVFRERVEYAADRINKIPGLSVINPPKGTFYLFPNIKDTGLTSEEFAREVLEDAHILVLPGTAFGECGEGYVRMSCTMDIKQIAEAMDRLEKKFTK